MSPDNMPDFNSMSPEEIMAWMETLAKRQGATEGFTTAADAQIAEIDPNSVVIDEPGYIPYQEQSTAPEPAVSQPPAPAFSVPPPPVSLPQEPPRPAEVPAAMLDDDLVLTSPSPSVGSEVSGGALAWLESLAADQSDSLFNLDLMDEEAAPAPTSDPVSWLEDLARAQGELGPLPTQPEAAPAPVVEDELQVDLNWLETLALRQGARPEELITPHDADIPPSAPVRSEEPVYTPFSFETPARTPAAAPAEPSDPSAWLRSLAAEQGYDEVGVKASRPEPPAPKAVDLSEEGIKRAIADGTVTSEQMQVWLNIQADRAVQQPEIPLIDEEELDLEGPPVRAEIPDWLIDQVGAPPADDLPAVPDTRPAFESLFPATSTSVSAEPEIPDWLLEETESEEPLSIESVFAVDAPPVESAAAPAIEVDPNDPWVEAFDLEHDQGAVDIFEVPDWYTSNISDPARIARVEGLAGEEAVPEPAAPTGAGPLFPARFAEEAVLPEGEAQPLPDWLVASLPLAAPEPVVVAPPVAEPISAEPIPEWLVDVESEITPADIPDWLKQSIEESASPVEPVVEALPVELVIAQAVPLPAAPPPARPAPAPYTGSATLDGARTRNKSGDLDGSLKEYEALIRANVQVNDIVDDLTSLSKLHRGHPVVYRVLGDGLMRQGKLQQALDIYREALSQL